MTEAEDEFPSLCEELEQEIQPMSFIERIYVRDIAALLSEIIRLRRFKTATLNNALRIALSNILKQILFKPEFLEKKPDYELEAEGLTSIGSTARKPKLKWQNCLANFISTSPPSKPKPSG